MIGVGPEIVRTPHRRCARGGLHIPDGVQRLGCARQRVRTVRRASLHRRCGLSLNRSSV